MSYNHFINSETNDEKTDSFAIHSFLFTLTCAVDVFNFYYANDLAIIPALLDTHCFPLKCFDSSQEIWTFAVRILLLFVTYNIIYQHQPSN